MAAPFIPAQLPQVAPLQPAQQPPTIDDVVEAERYTKRLKTFHKTSEGDLISAAEVERAELYKIGLQLQLVGGGAGQQSNQEILNRLDNMQAHFAAMQAQFAAMQAQFAAMQARQRNAIALETGSQVYPVPNTQGHMPVALPSTRNEIGNMKGQQLDQFLQFYGIAFVGTTLQDRRRLLQQELGIPPPLFTG